MISVHACVVDVALMFVITLTTHMCVQSHCVWCVLSCAEPFVVASGLRNARPVRVMNMDNQHVCVHVCMGYDECMIVFEDMFVLGIVICVLVECMTGCACA